MRLILANDPTDGKLWDHIKKNPSLVETLAKIDSSKERTLFRFKNKPQAVRTLQEVFSSENAVFEPMSKVLSRKKLGEVLSYFIDHFEFDFVQEALTDIAKNHKDRLNTFIKNETPPLVRVAFQELCKAEPHKTINQLMDFTAVCGDSLVKEMRTNKELSDFLFSYLKPLNASFISQFESAPFLMWKSLHRFDPVRLRSEALKFADQPTAHNFVEEALALGVSQNNFEALAWLMETDARLFIQLVGKSNNLAGPKGAPFPFEEIFKTKIVLTLDPNNFPTAEELTQFYTNLAPVLPLKPELHIPATTSEKLESIYAVLKAVDKKDYENVKVFLEDPVFALRKDLPEESSPNMPLLACFGVSKEQFGNMSKADATELRTFIQKGECTLKNASQFYSYLKNYKALDYASAEKQPVKDPKRNLNVTWKTEDNAFEFEVHKGVFSGINEHIDEMFRINNEEVKDQLIKVEEGPDFKPSVIPLFLDWMYGKKAFNAENISDKNELKSLLYLTDHFSIQSWVDSLTLKFFSLYDNDPSLIQELNLDGRKDLFNRMADLKDKEYYFYKMKLLTGMAPKERKELINSIIGRLKLDIDTTVTDKSNEQQVREHDFVNILRGIRDELTDEESQDLLLKVKELDRPNLMYDLLHRVCGKKPFTLLLKTGQNLEVLKWYLAKEPSYIASSMEAESKQNLNSHLKSGTDYIPLLLTVDKRYRDQLYAILQEIDLSDIKPHWYDRGLFNLLLDDIDNPQARDFFAFLKKNIEEPPPFGPGKLKEFNELSSLIEKMKESNK